MAFVRTNLYSSSRVLFLSLSSKLEMHFSSLKYPSFFCTSLRNEMKRLRRFRLRTSSRPTTIPSSTCRPSGGPSTTSRKVEQPHLIHELMKATMNRRVRLGLRLGQGESSGCSRHGAEITQKFQVRASLNFCFLRGSQSQRVHFSPPSLLFPFCRYVKKVRRQNTLPSKCYKTGLPFSPPVDGAQVHVQRQRVPQYGERMRVRRDDRGGRVYLPGGAQIALLSPGGRAAHGIRRSKLQGWPTMTQ